MEGGNNLDMNCSFQFYCFIIRFSQTMLLNIFHSIETCNFKHYSWYRPMLSQSKMCFLYDLIQCRFILCAKDLWVYLKSLLISSENDVSWGFCRVGGIAWNMLPNKVMYCFTSSIILNIVLDNGYCIIFMINQMQRIRCK